MLKKFMGGDIMDNNYKKWLAGYLKNFDPERPRYPTREKWEEAKKLRFSIRASVSWEAIGMIMATSRYAPF